MELRNRHRGRTLLALLAAGALAVGAAACTESEDSSTDQNGTTATTGAPADLLGPDRPASGEPVRIGMISDGATDAYDNTDELRTAQATADYYNQHQAGIAGRPIELVTCATNGDAAKALDCANTFIAEGVIAVAVPPIAVLEPLWRTLHDAGVPTYISQTVGEQYEQDTESTFLGNNPLSALALPITVAEDVGTDRIAFVVIDVPQAIEIIEGSGTSLLEKAGIDYDVIKVPIGTADMTAQMQQVASSGAGVAMVVGNDSFCIAAFQGLAAVGFTGRTTVVNYCITEATREALPGQLEGISTLGSYAIGDLDDPSYQKYLAVMETYGEGITDLATTQAVAGYGVAGALFAALSGLTGEPTPAAATEAIKTMAEAETPAGGGSTFQCGGSAAPAMPAVCTNQWLRTDLDADGNPTSYTLEDSTELFQ